MDCVEPPGEEVGCLEDGGGVGEEWVVRKGLEGGVG